MRRASHGSTLAAASTERDAGAATARAGCPCGEVIEVAIVDPSEPEKAVSTTPRRPPRRTEDARPDGWRATLRPTNRRFWILAFVWSYLAARAFLGTRSATARGQRFDVELGDILRFTVEKTQERGISSRRLAGFGLLVHLSETNYGEVTIDKEHGKATVVGVIEHFSWKGGVGDPICIDAYISAENAQVLSAKMKGTLDTNTIKKLGWWICDFDAETKVWFECAYPKDPHNVQGQLNANGSTVELGVAPEPTRVAPNVQVNVYHMHFQVIPAANSTFALHFATSSKTNFVKNWGLKVGSNAAQALPPNA